MPPSISSSQVSSEIPCIVPAEAGRLGPRPAGQEAGGESISNGQGEGETHLPQGLEFHGCNTRG